MKNINSKNNSKFFSILILFPIGILVFYFIYSDLTYYDEINRIKKDLNKIPNVLVVDIWAGNYDITLEEVTARLKVKNKGELVLYGLSKDVYNYPNTIQISEIGGYSFRTITKNGYGHNINIGKQGGIQQLFPFQLHTPKDVISHYDEILEIIKKWAIVPKLNHIHSKNNKEFFIAVLPKKVHDGADFIEQSYHDDFYKYFPNFTISDYNKWSKFINSLPWENNNSK